MLQTSFEKKTGKTGMAIETLNILYVEDSETDAYTVKRTLSKGMRHPCRVQHVTTLTEATSALEKSEDIDLILLDLGLPDSEDHEQTFQQITKANEHDIPIVVLTSLNDYEAAMAMVGSGAEDFVKKSTMAAEPEILCSAIDFAVCRHRNLTEIKEDTEKKLDEKDQVIHWMSGGYSVQP